MSPSDTRRTAGRTSPSTRSTTAPGNIPPLEIFFSMASAPLPFGCMETYTFTTLSVIPGAIPTPIVVPAMSVVGGEARIIRWRSDKPFIFFPEFSADWRPVPGHNWKFLPNAASWVVACSLPSDDPPGYFLELQTRNTNGTHPDQAGYRMIGVDDLAITRFLTHFTEQTAAELFRQLVRTIMVSLSSKATIIILE